MGLQPNPGPIVRVPPGCHTGHLLCEFDRETTVKRLHPLPCLLALGLTACASQPTASPHASATLTPIAVPQIQRPQQETAAWWFTAGAAAAHANVGATPPRAKNVIVFLGDGMSIPTIAAAHILLGQRQGKDGESARLSFETLPYTALSRTYETDSQTPDSAGTMTAIMSGVKTKAGFIGVGQGADRADCASSKGDELLSGLELAELAGLSTGAVTTTKITHATPAATYGHLPERNWEGDVDVANSPKGGDCLDFARQLVEQPFGNGLEVALGGGRENFMLPTQRDPEEPGRPGKRLDQHDLIAQWSARPGASYVWNKEQFDKVDIGATTHLLGLFERSHMRFDHDRLNPPEEKGRVAADEPSLAEMTRTALKILKKNPKGYFLMVEGGRIDHGHHAGNAYRALTDTIAFSDAIQAAMDDTDAADTLIVVTSDHSHTMYFSGYPQRGNPILGLVHGGSDFEDSGEALALDQLGLPYTTLGYANGPGYTGPSDSQPQGPKTYPHYYKKLQGPSTARPDLRKVDTQAPDYMQESVVPFMSESHGGEDVAIFARGPGAQAFHGELEQNVIFHIIVQSAPLLRKQLCASGSCNADGVPVNLPDRAALLPKAK
ncbi:alkaline phosphatase [Tahibacter aquaticus]|uniref:Alkaline phosphatase n=1 Tax=Tahibacter aquaticus TaxID=520092 RepID=A0A4R6YSC5_9GAMM|nr:alkaline phosphatase [Tahibacter aquaticus]